MSSPTPWWGATPSLSPGPEDQSSPQPSPQQSKAAQPLILLVEDDLSSARALKAILSKHGYEVATAGTVASALEQLSRATPQFVILDLMLPDGEGSLVLSRIRTGNLPIRVLVTTAAVDTEMVNRTKALAPDLFLEKPLDLARLLRGLKAEQ